MTGIIDDEVLSLPIGDALNPILKFFLQYHLLGSILREVDILRRDSEGLLAVFGKDAGIVNGIRDIRDKTVVLVADNEGIGVVASVVSLRDNGINARGHVVVVNIEDAACGQLFNSSRSKAILCGIAGIDVRGQTTHFAIIERMTNSFAYLHLISKDMMAEYGRRAEFDALQVGAGNECLVGDTALIGNLDAIERRTTREGDGLNTAQTDGQRDVTQVAAAEEGSPANLDDITPKEDDLLQVLEFSKGARADTHHARTDLDFLHVKFLLCPRSNVVLHVVVGDRDISAFLAGVGDSEGKAVKNPLYIWAAGAFRFVDGRLCPA